MVRAADRKGLSFRAVNRPDLPGYDPGLQRHHLLPRQLLGHPGFARMLESMPEQAGHFHDFRRNGVLLPCEERAAKLLGLPLHRGPHREYSDLVIERIGQIEAAWARLAPVDPAGAREQAAMRLELLRRALRRMILDPRRTVRLNRKDPFLADDAFSDLDAMADALWGGTA